MDIKRSGYWTLFFFYALNPRHDYFDFSHRAIKLQVAEVMHQIYLETENKKLKELEQARIKRFKIFFRFFLAGMFFIYLTLQVYRCY